MARFAARLSLILSIASCAFGQSNGILPFSTQAGGGIDSVDLATSNIYLQIPLRGKPGAVPAQFSLVLNSSAYVANGKWAVSGGLAGTPLRAALRLTATITPLQTCGSSNKDTVFSNYSLVDPTGAYHSLPGVTIDTLGCHPPPANPIVASDHSGYSVQFTGTAGTASDPSGNSTPVTVVVTLPSTTLTDPDGNTLVYSSTPSTGAMSFTDTLGQTVVSGTIHSNSAPGSQSSAETYQYTDVNGTNQTFTVTYTGKVQRTAFGCSGVTEINTGSTLVYFPTNVARPDGSSYQIAYEATPGYSSDVTGRIASVTLPTGGSISYSYSDTAGHNGMNCTSQVVPTVTRTVNDHNGNSSPWTYASTRSGGSPDNYTVTVTDPASNQVVYSFSGELQTQVASYQGSATGTPLQITLTCYNANFTNCAAPSSTVPYPITQRDVYTNFNSSSATAGNLVEAKYDSYGNVTALKKYDWGQTLISQTYLSYGQSWNGTTCSAYSSSNIYNTPCYIHTENSSGTDVAKTQITYSSTGHPTSTSKWVSGSTWLTSSASFATNGALSSVTDVNSAVTSYSNFACNGLLPQTVTLPQISGESFQMSTSVVWNCNGGVITSSTDVNGNTTTYAYDDPLWRLTNVARPDGGSTGVAYSTSATFPWTITTTTATDASHNVTAITYLDGLGRTYAVYTTDPDATPGSEGYSRVWTTYNKLGQVSSVSNPYYTTSDPTYGFTSYQYDALGRTTRITNADNTYKSLTYNGPDLEAVDENSVTKVYQSDGLGRLTSVCEGTTATQKGSYGTPSTCNQSPISATGFLTSYTYDGLGDLLSVAESGVASRTYQYDGLSRLTQETNPESGITTYAYDASGQQGDLYQRTRPAPNQTGTTCPTNCVTTTYSFDPLHRLTYKSYSDTSAPIPTPPVGYGHDESNVWGTVVTNYKGRLTHASTSPAGASLFSYDTVGNMTYGWQCDPFDCGTAAVEYWYTYNYVGIPTSEKMGDNVTENGFITYTHTLDANGRITQEASSDTSTNHPSPLYTVQSYNALNEVTADTLGNGIQRGFTYDIRGRLTNRTDGSAYSLGVTYQSNNDVQKVNDSVNGNWTYGYDGFNRLSTASETGQAFTYSYDPAGNRWGTISGVTQYDFNTYNHITNGGITYDAAGNVTYDGFHSYTYDAENRMITVDGGVQSYFYDAFGRQTQTIYAGNTYSRIFGLNGKTEVQFQGTTWALSELYIGSTGGYLGNYSNNTTYFAHSDQVGTRRAYTGPTGGTPVETCTTLPFGDGSTCTGSGTGSVTAYTGQDWDPATNLTRFPMRNYQTVEGRWMHPDPAGLAAVNIANPQTWNRYAYVMNNPVSFTDPLGLVIKVEPPDPCDTYYEDGLELAAGECNDNSEADFSTGDNTGIGPAGPVPTFGGGAGGGGRGTPMTPLPKPPVLRRGQPQCFAQLKSRSVNALTAQAFGATHSFWYVQDTLGNQSIVSGGPTGPSGNGFLNVWTNDNTQGGVDNVSATTSWNSGLSADNCSGADDLMDAASAWPQNTIPYFPTGPNSNSVANYLGQSGGFSPPPPPGSYGWGTPIMFAGYAQ